MKPKRFAFIPLSKYDAPTSRGLCSALTELGHSAQILPPPRLWLPNLRTVHRRPGILDGFDVVVEINMARDDSVPKDTVHIAWIQDYGKGDPHRDYDQEPLAPCVYNSPSNSVEKTATFQHYNSGDAVYENSLGHDLIYTLGDPDILGCPKFKQWAGSLAMGVDETLLQRPIIEPTLDFSIAGFMPPALWFDVPTVIPADLEPGQHFSIMAEIVEMIVQKSAFRPLYGKFDQLAEFARFQANLQELLTHCGWSVDEGGLRELHKYGARITHEYARFVNRQAIAKLILTVSQDVEFWGLNWSDCPWLKPYVKPFAESVDLLNLYQRSRINVHDNIYGFALHSRVLEAMAVGGFVMAHESPHVGKAGQMTETFEPDAHFGQYNAENFAEEAHYWLHADRQRPIAEARKVIRDKHLWKHRAQQILDDLA